MLKCQFAIKGKKIGKYNKAQDICIKDGKGVL